MQDKLQERLNSLKTEYEAGQKMMAELEAKQIHLRDTLLRISGAIQIVEEFLNDDGFVCNVDKDADEILQEINGDRNEQIL